MLDVSAILSASRRFYEGHRLVEWANAVPRTVTFSDEDQTTLARAVKHGFTQAFVFPPFGLQMATLDRLIDETARKPAPVPDNQQYREPFLADDWSRTPNGKVLQRLDDLGAREWGPYWYLFSPNPLPKTWGLTGKQIHEQFQAKDWHGLTVPEYVVLQRHFCETHGDHRFFEKPEDDSGAYWLWLIDSNDGKNCTVAQGKAGGVNLQACGINNRDSKRATIGGVLVAL